MHILHRHIHICMRALNVILCPRLGPTGTLEWYIENPAPVMELGTHSQGPE